MLARYGRRPCVSITLCCPGLSAGILLRVLPYTGPPAGRSTRQDREHLQRTPGKTGRGQVTAGLAVRLTLPLPSLTPKAHTCGAHRSFLPIAHSACDGRLERVWGTRSLGLPLLNLRTLCQIPGHSVSDRLSPVLCLSAPLWLALSSLSVVLYDEKRDTIG